MAHFSHAVDSRHLPTNYSGTPFDDEDEGLSGARRNNLNDTLSGIEKSTKAFLDKQQGMVERRINRSILDTSREGAKMLNNFHWKGRTTLANAFNRSVTILNHASRAANQVAQKSPQWAPVLPLVLPVLTGVGSLVTGRWPVVQTIFQKANAASCLVAGYQKCKSLGFTGAAAVAGISWAGQMLMDKIPSIQHPIIPNILWAKNSIQGSSLIKHSIIQNALFVTRSIQESSPIQHPIMQNILWATRWSSVAALASLGWAAAKSVSDDISKQKAAARAAPKIRPPKKPPTPPSPSAIADFQNRVDALQIIDGNKLCMMSGSVQTLAEIGLERYELTPASDLPFLQEISNLTRPIETRSQRLQDVRDQAFRARCAAVMKWNALLEINDIKTASPAQLKVLQGLNGLSDANDVIILNQCMLKSRIYIEIVGLLDKERKEFPQGIAALYGKVPLKERNVWKQVVASAMQAALQKKNGVAEKWLEVCIEDPFNVRSIPTVEEAQKLRTAINQLSTVNDTKAGQALHRIKTDANQVVEGLEVLSDTTDLIEKDYAANTRVPAASKTDCANDLKKLNEGMFTSQIYTKMMDVLANDPKEFPRGIANIYRKLHSNEQILFKEIIMFVMQTAINVKQSEVEKWLADCINKPNNAAYSTKEYTQKLSTATFKLSKTNHQEASDAWNRIAKVVPINNPGAQVVIDQQIHEATKAQADSMAKLSQRSAKHEQVINNIDLAPRAETHSYPFVHVEIEENRDGRAQIYVGQALSGEGGFDTNRTMMLDSDMGEVVKNMLRHLDVEEGIRYAQNQHNGAERLFVKRDLEDDIQRLGKLDLHKLHFSEEYLTKITPGGEACTYGSPEITGKDIFGFGKKEDHELTAAMFLSMGLDVQSKLIKQFVAGTLFNTESLENIEGMIGFLDLCQNHRVTNLKARFVPSYLTNEAYQNHLVGFSMIRDKIIDRLAELYAIESTANGVASRRLNTAQPAQPQIFEAQGAVLLNAMGDLSKLLKIGEKEPLVKYNGPQLHCDSFQTDYTNLRHAVVEITKALATCGKKTADRLAACHENVTAPAQKQDWFIETLPRLEWLYRSAASMMHALENIHVGPVIAPIIKGMSLADLKTNLAKCLKSINQAYKESLVNAECNNEDLPDAAKAYKLYVKANKRAEINARQNFYLNYFESPEPPKNAKQAAKRNSDLLQRGKQATRAGLSIGAQIAVTGAQMGANIAVTGAQMGANIAVTGAQMGANIAVTGAQMGAQIAATGAQTIFGVGLRFATRAMGGLDSSAPPPAYTPPSFSDIPVAEEASTEDEEPKKGKHVTFTDPFKIGPGINYGPVSEPSRESDVEPSDPSVAMMEPKRRVPMPAWLEKAESKVASKDADYFRRLPQLPRVPLVPRPRVTRPLSEAEFMERLEQLHGFSAGNEMMSSSDNPYEADSDTE